MPKLELQIAGTWRDAHLEKEQKKQKSAQLHAPLTSRVLSKEDAEAIFSSKNFDRFRKEA